MPQFSSSNQPAKRRGGNRTAHPMLMREVKKREREISAKLADLAAKGDPTALKLVASKMAADLRPVMPCVKFNLNESASLTEKCESILYAISDGVLPPDVGGSLLNSIAGVLRVAENDHIKSKLADLELRLEQLLTGGHVISPAQTE